MVTLILILVNIGFRPKTLGATWFGCQEKHMNSKGKLYIFFLFLELICWVFAICIVPPRVQADSIQRHKGMIVWRRDDGMLRWWYDGIRVYGICRPSGRANKDKLETHTYMLPEFRALLTCELFYNIFGKVLARFWPDFWPDFDQGLETQFCSF